MATDVPSAPHGPRTVTQSHRNGAILSAPSATMLLLAREATSSHATALTFSSPAGCAGLPQNRRQAAFGLKLCGASTRSTLGLSTGARDAKRSRARRSAVATVSPGGVGARVESGDAPALGHSEEQEGWMRRIQYYGGREMWSRAEEKFEQMQAEGVRPTLAICNALMEAYLKGKRYVNAVGFLEDMCLGNITGGAADGNHGNTVPIAPDIQTLNLVLATLASGGKWKKALALSAPMRALARSDSRRTDVAAPRGSVRAGGRGKGTRANNSTAATMAAVTSVAAEIPADGETFTHLIVACGKGGEPDRSREIYDEMRAAGLSATPEATAALIRSLAKANRGPAECLRLLGDMRASESQTRRRGRGAGGVSPSEASARKDSFSGVIEACARVGEWQKAVSLLDEMRQAGLSPDSRCYGYAMRACSAAGNWQLCLALLNTMKKERVTRTAFNYNIAMQACRKAGRNRKAMSLLAEMEEAGVQPDIVSYNTCVTIAGQTGRLEEALELLRIASEEKGLQLDLVSYRAALGGLRREKRWEAAVKLLDDMQRRGVGPDEVSTAMAMNTCVAAQQPLRAVELFDDLRNAMGVLPRISSVTAVLEALADLGQWEEALRELRALSASGIKPNGRAIALAMGACNAAKHWDETISLGQYAEKMGIECSVEALILLARAHGARKDVQAVARVLAVAEQSQAAADNDGPLRARRLLPELYEVAARSLAIAGDWEKAADAVRKLEGLVNRNTSNARSASAGQSTYELIMGAAASAGRDDAVLAQADAARAALRRSDTEADSGSRRLGELSAAALAHEVAAAGRRGQWDRVSPIIATAMRSLRGSAGVRLYNALVPAAAACGKPERGLEIFREIARESGARGGRGSDSAETGGGGDLESERLLPPPDEATFLGALDACAAVNEQRTVDLAVEVAKLAAAAARRTPDIGETKPVEGDSRGPPAAGLPPSKLAAVLAKASEVCEPWDPATAGALAEKAQRLRN